MSYTNLFIVYLIEAYTFGILYAIYLSIRDLKNEKITQKEQIHIMLTKIIFSWYYIYKYKRGDE